MVLGKQSQASDPVKAPTQELLGKHYQSTVALDLTFGCTD